jgi:hypothetical protein
MNGENAGPHHHSRPNVEAGLTAELIPSICTLAMRLDAFGASQAFI